jgi:hypothetical protein
MVVVVYGRYYALIYVTTMPPHNFVPSHPNSSLRGPGPGEGSGASADHMKLARKIMRRHVHQNLCEDHSMEDLYSNSFC